ncbi:hypothetical protein A7S88_24835 [Salmonella enterica subsp. enterica serovar Rubislaw]|uniref:hypothetical protein n=1 Tax=Salmonella enterica TaxID=28901 RepID=UPI0008A9CBAF|nr:hypothetical protein [Salmonella enterica]OHK91292.1 hypothetical protein A7S88_24835 [Salmonella enterica subsp. enterica serovar Rubislaw]
MWWGFWFGLGGVVVFFVVLFVGGLGVLGFVVLVVLGVFVVWVLFVWGVGVGVGGVFVLGGCFGVGFVVGFCFCWWVFFCGLWFWGFIICFIFLVFI